MTPWKVKVELAKKRLAMAPFRRKVALLRYKLRKWRLGENHPGAGCPKCGGEMHYQVAGMTSIRVCSKCDWIEK